jgi:acyl-CoA hydrolase/GNAT superfamily N-acetyltransferase
MISWPEGIRKKLMTAKQAIGRIRPGDRIFVGTGCGQPRLLVEELVSEDNHIVDAEIYHLLTQGTAPYIREEYSRKFRTCSFFLAANVREGIASGRGDYVPIFLSEIPSLFRTGKIPLDVALVQTSPPDENGMVSLGISVDVVKAAVETSRTVIAEVNERMPRTCGDSLIPLDRIDALVESDLDLLEYRLPEPSPAVEAIARNVTSLIGDGSTVEVGIGLIPQAVLRYLGDKNDIGIHTEMFNDAIIPLVESGVINGRRKTINRGRITASFCLGTRKLYDFVDRNPLFEFRPSEYVNDPHVISRHRRMVAINVAIEVDMTGQVCSDSIGYNFYSGFGGQVDFNRGAARSKGGRAVIALPSTAKGGRISRIVPRLTEGAGVVLSRADVRYVVTEYGIADLFGRNIRERVLALAEVAHPDYRNEILKEARKRKYVFSYQKDLPPLDLASLRALETERILEDGTPVRYRPVHPSDATALRDLFYDLSEKSIAFRFFQATKSFPHRVAQEFSTLDLSKDMAVAALVREGEGERIVGVAHYYLIPDTDRAEVSFVVRDDWQARGIGTDLFEILTDIARRRGLKGFEAKVLAGNQNMLTVFYNSGRRISMRREDEVYSIACDFGDTPD